MTPAPHVAHAYTAMLAADERAGGFLLEQLDASEECRHGRLPYDRTPECGCWGQPSPLAVPEAAPPTSRVGLGRRLSDQEIIEAHRLHLRGVSIAELGRRLWKDAGYSGAESCEYALRSAFRLAGLWTRDRNAATALRHTTHGKTTVAVRKGDDRSDFNAFQRQQRLERPQCTAILASGKPCTNRARQGDNVCGHHTEEALSAKREHCARWRAALLAGAADRQLVLLPEHTAEPEMVAA